jgi:hypothetical protein
MQSPKKNNPVTSKTAMKRSYFAGFVESGENIAAVVCVATAVVAE